MVFLIIDGTKKPINKGVVTNKGIPVLTKNGNLRNVKNPLVSFDVEQTTVENKKGFFSDTTTTSKTTYRVKAFLSHWNKDATHEDVLDYLNTLTPEQFENGARMASNHQYRFSEQGKYNDIYLSEL